MLIELVNPEVSFVTPIERIVALPALIERAGRTCYRSEDKITPDSAEKFCRMLIRRGHESVLEHYSITVTFTTDRATTHQLVRHRLGAYSQESQRYCDYGEGVRIIRPNFEPGTKEFACWENAVKHCARAYQELREMGVKPEDAREVLPNCTATTIVTTYNIRQWRHVFRLRTSVHAQANIRGLMTMALLTMHQAAPCLFADLLPLAVDLKTYVGEDDG